MSEYCDINELLLADARVDPNLTEVDGRTPLYTAANLGKDRCVELLLFVLDLSYESTSMSGG